MSAREELAKWLQTAAIPVKVMGNPSAAFIEGARQFAEHLARQREAAAKPQPPTPESEVEYLEDQTN